jgi:hypothetical protein
MQILEPSEPAKVPGEHRRHAAELVDAVASLKVPTGHFTHDFLPNES